MTCPLCAASREPGWLCAEHGQPWGHDDCGAEAMPCTCNPDGRVAWREVFAAIDREQELVTRSEH